MTWNLKYEFPQESIEIWQRVKLDRYIATTATDYEKVKHTLNEIIL